VSDPYDRRYLQITEPFILRDLEQMKSAKNYSKWLFELVKSHVGKRVLEIGPGVGNITHQVIGQVDLLVGVEPNQYCADVLHQSLIADPRFVLINSSVENSDFTALKGYKFDTVLCINVLEHIEDDVATLQLFERLLEPGGKVILLVPACPQAYGPIDKAVGHFRRYSKLSLMKSLERTTFETEAFYYSNLLGLLGWLFNAKIRKSTSQSDGQIKVFDKVVPLVSFLEKELGCPAGLSLISVSRKKNEK